MADNIIKVNVTSNKQQRVTVSSAQVGTEITASSDTGKFWAQSAKNWAVSDFIVDNTDYSSKYYANVSKQKAQNSQTYAEAAQNTYNAFQLQSGEAIEELQTTKTSSIEEITTTKDTAIDNINSTKTTILQDIEFVADGEKKEIEDLIDNGKEELKESIDGIKVLTTLDIGDIGIAPLGIDETKGKRRYLNGQLIIQEQYVQFTEKVKKAVELYPTLACTESEWQTTATMTVGGQVGKFVVDDEGGTIRLPKIIMPIQGLTDLSKLAEIVEAGLPNITGSAASVHETYIASGDYKGCLYNLDNGTYINESRNNTGGKGLGFDASRSNPIYGNSNTVQQEQIQYPYFIQVATGAETEDNIINEIELNNPFSLLDYKFSEYELNNLSWLRSNGQFNTKIVYPAVYDLLLKIYNGIETKAGVSVKLSTETFTDYDFVLNTAEETFRLPVKVKLASGKAVVGNGTVLGLTNGTVEYGLSNYQGTNIGTGINITYTGFSGQKLPYNNSSWGSPATASDGLGVTTDATKSGIETSDSGLYLYFYVGETVQNANLINAGRIEEKINDKINRHEIKAYIIETYKNGSSWYRVWSDGWIEQGGYLITPITGNNTINFLKPFVNTDYTFTTTYAVTDTNNYYGYERINLRTVSSIVVRNYATCGLNWRVCGY